MFDDYNICPYPGLRSFAEDESIFFKGRESHIQEITELLEQNKFLMVTGASGDGKSSIIFAGLVPNARAGFFKAQYNSWQVAHFRPERSPVKNIAKTLAPLLGDRNPESIQTELMRGYGSLVDVYKSSDLYVDESAPRWLEANELEKKEQLRIASNLLIVADQFEEFFTNNENFNKGVPSQECQILVNLLLETSRIAIKEDLPIYVVFTMRSDFIGQCAAFRGLPEFIGYSQFFVPRLNRQELQQVIEEPAQLNGNKISRRLVERLLYDLREGIDQLPILQHTLNQIWHKADNGVEELDLIHYAKVGGMPSEDLPDEDIVIFESWYASLPEYQQDHLTEPKLNRVLDNHANELYEAAWRYYSDQPGTTDISVREVKLIIAMTFACLTKIDDSRAVRNIMTLEEITSIINQPHIDSETVGKVINIFREQGNTFIRPFIEEGNPESKKLTKDSALDITHESLIRNWERLEKWAEKEFEYYETYLDFKKQLDKWKESDQSRGYLLPIGPLTYFENWYNECRPNKYWIDRYEQVIDKEGGSVEKSEKILSDARLFLKKSAKKVAITRAYVKHGSAKAAALLAVIVVIVLSGFYYMDANIKQNSSVLDQISEEALVVLNSDEAGRNQKSIYLVLQELNEAGRFMATINSLDSVRHKVGIANAGYESLLAFYPQFDEAIKYDLIDFLDREILASSLSNDEKIEELNNFFYSLAIDKYHNGNDRIEKVLQNQLIGLTQVLIDIVQQDDVESKIDLNQCIEAIINFSNDPDETVALLLNQLSPYSEKSKVNFEKLYPGGSGIPNGRVGNVSHNGGYQIMAYLYAVLGDIDKVIQSTDSLAKYNSNYWQLLVYNNGFNTLGYLLQYEHYNEASKYLNYIQRISGHAPMTFYQLLTDRTGYLKSSYHFNHFGIPNYNVGLSLLPYDGIEWIFDQYEKEILKIEDANTRHYYLAMVYKQRGSYLHKHFHDKGIEIEQDVLDEWFGKSIREFREIDEAFLDGEIEISYRYYSTGFRNVRKKRNDLFRYPDHFDHSWFNEKYVGTKFIEYVINQGLFDWLYRDERDLDLINDWIANYNEVYPDFLGGTNAERNNTELDTEVLELIWENLSMHPKFGSFDNTLLNLELSNRYFDEGDSATALKYYNLIDPAQLQVTANKWEYLNLTYIDNVILNVAKKLAGMGMHEDAKGFLETMPNNNYKSVVYSRLTNFVYDTKYKNTAFMYLDSAFTKGDKVDKSRLVFQFDYRYYLTNALSGIGGADLNEIAEDIFVELPPGLKDFALQEYFVGIASDGNYYRAMQTIPEYFSGGQRLGPYGFILNEEANKLGIRPGWEEVAQHINWVFKEYVVFNANF